MSTLIPIKKTPGDPTGEYIVELKNNESLEIVLKELGISKATHEWNIEKHGFAGLGGKFDDKALHILQASPEVTAITKDTYLEGLIPINGLKSWGLDRLSRVDQLPAAEVLADNNYTYRYNPAVTPGRQVDIYILDSGIHGAHPDFHGRVQPREDFTNPDLIPEVDDELHGTWVASIAGSDTYGVTKHANYRLFDIKVLPGGVAHTVNALAHVRDQAGNPNLRVVNFSVSWPVALPVGAAHVHSRPLHIGFALTTQAGIHVVAAAGNQKQDVDAIVGCPSHIPGVIAVGATARNDEIWRNGANDGSNFGESVDVFAPGHDIIGAAHDHDPENAENFPPSFRGSGTSAAAAHVAGLVAYLLMTEDPCTPAVMKQRIRGLAEENSGVLLNLVAVTAGTTTRLAYNNGGA